MNIVIFEDWGYRDLLPLTWTRACFELRCGVDTLLDKIRAGLGEPVTQLLVRSALSSVVRQRYRLAAPQPDRPSCLINARALVSGTVTPPEPGVAWHVNGEVVAAAMPAAQAATAQIELFMNPQRLAEWLDGFETRPPPAGVRLIRYPWDLITANEAELRRQCVNGGVQQGQIYPGAHLLEPSAIHIAADARIKPGVVLDAESGPIHIDRAAQVQANAVIEGPCYIGPRSIIRPGATLRGGVSIGPVCKIGGEVEGVIVHSYSNKQHDGFLGHSYLASWVNLGADTVTSDLKNTYGAIRASINGVGVETGLHFLGSIIGDHAKTGIGTILPTGCVIGLAANVFTQRPVPKFVPSFAWLTDEGLTRYRTAKAIDIARIVMGRRDLELTRDEQRLIELAAESSEEIEAPGWA